MSPDIQYTDYHHKDSGWARRIVLAGFLLVLGLAILVFLAGSSAKTELIEQNPPTGRLVDVNGHWLHLNCQGEGRPTVILGAGLGDFSTHWSIVQPEIAKFSRVCVYDRAGLGWSEPGPGPRTSEMAVRDLHDLLREGGVKPPFLLVGHSFGGLHMRLFANHFPEEVMGLVLVDAVHETQDSRIPAYGIANEQVARQFRWLVLLREIGIVPLFAEWIPDPGLPAESLANYRAVLATTKYFETSIAEVQALETSFAEFRLIPDPSLGDLPLIIISRGLGMAVPGLSADENEQVERVWQELQAELSALSSNSQHIIAEKSGHNIALQQPELVVEAIRQLAIQEQPILASFTPANTSKPPDPQPSNGGQFQDRAAVPSVTPIARETPTLIPSATPEPTPTAASLEVTFTLRTIYRNGKMLYEGVGGEFDGVINPTLVVKPGTVVQAVLVNGDGMTHDLYFPDFKAKTDKIGRREQTAQVTFSIAADQVGIYVYYCTLPGHRQAGQEGQIVVKR